MFDSQKLSFEKFLLDYKHGVYVFTKDSCQVCSDYKKSIEYINNRNLFFVEVISNQEEEICEKIFDRRSFPITVGYKDNEIEFIRLGMLFDLQMGEIMKFLEPFGNRLLTAEEKQEKIKKLETRCKLTYYVFPPDTSEDVRTKWMAKAIKYNELPIDVAKVGPGLTSEQREHMLEGNYKFASMVVFDDGNTNIYGEFEQRIIVGYSIKNQDIKFVKRNIDEDL